MKNLKVALSLVTIFLFLGNLKSQFFTSYSTPDHSGEREATVIVDLRGLKVSDVTIEMVYGTDSLEVKNAFDFNKRNPSKYFVSRASKTDLNNGKVFAKVRLDNNNNIALRKLLVSKGVISTLLPNVPTKAIESGKKVYYMWSRSHIPSGASQELTIDNINVQSFIMPRPFTIAYLGDSYASGEGAKGTKWIDETCHRSDLSGGVLAIEKLINSRPNLEIVYKNVTCSGATVLNFFLQAQKKDVLIGTAIKQGIQVDLVDEWLNSLNYENLDILLADGGGNDIGFAGVVQAGLMSFMTEVRKNSELMTAVNTQISKLPDIYESFNDYMKKSLAVNRVVWFNYPNLMTNSDGLICRPEFGSLSNACWGPLEQQISLQDFQFFKTNIYDKLNLEVSKAANLFGWSFVNIENKSINNGICNCNGYFNTVGQSLLSQGDQNGAFHPNQKGFLNIYRDAIYSQLSIDMDKILTMPIVNQNALSLSISNIKKAASASFLTRQIKTTDLLKSQSAFQQLLGATLK